MPALCPLCASDDYTKEERTDDGRLYAICASAEHDVDGFVWDPIPPPGKSLRSDGLGVNSTSGTSLLECVSADRQIQAYGDVENRRDCPRSC